MSVADRFVFHGAQPEALRGIVGRLLEPAVIEHQSFRLAIFEEQLAVIGTVEAARDNLGKARPVEPSTIDK